RTVSANSPAELVDALLFVVAELADDAARATAAARQPHPEEVTEGETEPAETKPSRPREPKTTETTTTPNPDQGVRRGVAEPIPLAIALGGAVSLFSFGGGGA